MHAQCLEVTSGAAALYLQDLSSRFAAELWEYVASGLSIQAHDRAVFGAGTEARKQHECEEAMRAAGRARAAAAHTGGALIRSCKPECCHAVSLLLLVMASAAGAPLTIGGCF